MTIPKWSRYSFGIALLISILLWNAPWGHYFLYPFKLLATWVHEMCHGFAMVVTGAGLSHVELFPDTSGLAYAQWGTSREGQLFIATSGYTGTPIVGGVLLLLSQNPKRSRFLLLSFATILVACAIWFISNQFGLFATVGWGLGLLVGGIYLNPQWRTLLLNIIAAQTCLNAVLDIHTLFAPRLIIDGQPANRSDAITVSELMGWGSPKLWAALWLIWSLGVFFLTLAYMRRIHRMEPSTVATSSRK